MLVSACAGYRFLNYMNAQNIDMNSCGTQLLDNIVYVIDSRFQYYAIQWYYTDAIFTTINYTY